MISLQVSVEGGIIIKYIKISLVILSDMQYVRSRFELYEGKKLGAIPAPD